MSKMIQIRNVPNVLHRKLKARAATEGMSLSDYLLAELRTLASQPTMREFIEGLHERESTELSTSAAEVIRAERDVG